MQRYECDTCFRTIVSNKTLEGKEAICNKVTRHRQKGGRLRRVPCRGNLVLQESAEDEIQKPKRKVKAKPKAVEVDTQVGE